MAIRYDPHKCALPECDRETRNKQYCCPEHCQEGARRKYVESLKSKVKICDVCRNKKPLIDFFHRGKPGRVYFRSRCNDCVSKNRGKSKSTSLLVADGDVTYIQILKGDKGTGTWAIIDTADVHLVEGRGWRLNRWGYPAAGHGKTLHKYIIGDSNGFEIDHKNRDKLDNRRSNLRLATREQNAKNRPMYKNNKSGVPGVSWRDRDKRWQASIRIDKKCTTIGTFVNFEDAKNARIAAEEKYYGEYAPQ